MNRNVFLGVVVAALLWPGHGHAQKRLTAAKAVPAGLHERIKQFFADKEAQAHALAKQENQEQVPEIWEFFKAGENGDWTRMADLYRTLRRGAYQFEGGKKDPRLVTMVWQPVNESFGAYDDCANGEEKYVTFFAGEILDAMPAGSVYFGGTDPGRWLVTAFSKSHAKADPCFVITQNALADGLYLKYVRVMYGDRLVLPTDEDSQKAFQDYVTDAGLRLKNGKLKPGENVTDVGGKVQVSGQVAVMEINARLAKVIFDANPDREFFVEESFPLDWMYPHLSPQGPIMKIHRNPPMELPAEAVRKDHDYWSRFTDRALGKWLTSDISMKVLCEFATQVFENKEMGEFKGDQKFVRNGNACKTYSKLRSSIGGVYAWRAKNSTSSDERQRMTKEAEFALRQAFALCPYSPEAVVRYADLLVQQNRKPEALLLAQTAEEIDPTNRGIADLVEELEGKK